MQYCVRCGRQLQDEDVYCFACGCRVTPQRSVTPDLLSRLSEKVKTNGILWLILGCLQILLGILQMLSLQSGYFVSIVGVLNIINAVNDLKYSTTVLENPVGIVGKFEPLTAPILTMVYNLLFGGLIGVIGSIYYLVAIRGFVMENKAEFLRFDPNKV